MLKIVHSTIIFILLFTTNAIANDKPTLLFYCGITMVKPMQKIANIIESKHNCNIRILQGGSKNLYNSLKLAKRGDLYLPGSDIFRTKNLKDGILLDGVYIGFNQAAIFVRKGNPKQIKGLESLVDENIAVAICNPKTGSIGKNTKKVIIKYKNEEYYEDVFDASVEIGTDSRNLNKAIIDKRIDMTINWKATASWSENRPFIDKVTIDEKYAPKKRLVLNLLSFSKNKEIAKAFMNYAKSKDGQKIMKEYGFLD